VKKSGLSVIVPVFRNAANLPQLLERIGAALAALELDCEILLVDDGSSDESWSEIVRLAALDSRVRGFRLRRNFGQHNALLCGLRAARFDKAVTLDDDLQNPPEEIAKLLAALEPEVDVVYGSPEREQHGLWRNLASQVTKIVLSRTMGAATARRVSAFRIFRTALRVGFERYQGPFVNLDVLLTWSTNRFRSITVRHDPRRVGQSNYGFGRLFQHALNMLTGFSTLPLRLATLIGFVFTFFGLGTLAYVVGRYLIIGSPVPGFPFLASTIAILSGAQLFALGILGEYLARVYLRTMEQPAYVVGSATETTSDG
jgi:undecaprenyl-phosphate 4-deoxy-4-formamido-L-arabinose transferase